MFKTTFICTILVVLAGCSGDAAIRKTNCWNTMALVPAQDCEFHYVDAR